MRKNIFVKILSVCDFFGGIFRNAFVKEEKIDTLPKLQKFLVCNVITSLLTGGIVASSIIRGSILWTNFLYAFSSIQKRLAIMWAEGVGFGWNGLAGVRFALFEKIKEDLIANNKIAQFLNSLAGDGAAAKVLQVMILTVCALIFAALLLMCLKSLNRIAWAIKAMMKPKSVKPCISSTAQI